MCCVRSACRRTKYAPRGHFVADAEGTRGSGAEFRFAPRPRLVRAPLREPGADADTLLDLLKLRFATIDPGAA